MSKIISEYIKEARKAQRMTLRTLSEKSGVSVGHLSEFENGKTELGGDKLVKVCKVLGISTDVERGLISEPLTGYEAATIHRALTPDQEQILQALEGKPIAQQFIMDMMQLDEPDMLNAYSDFVRNWKGKN